MKDKQRNLIEDLATIGPLPNEFIQGIVRIKNVVINKAR
jgi:hypothetical protein